MSRLGTVGLCALGLAIFVGVAEGGESVDAKSPAAGIKPDSTRPIEVGTRDEAKARAKFMRVLEEPTEFEFNELPLSDVVSYLKSRHHVEIQLDTKVLEEASIGVDTPVTRTLRGITLRAALRLMLGALDLTYVIKDEVLLITTPDKASNELVTRIYPVSDLVTPRSATLGGEDFKPLIGVITETIRPTTWGKVGGPGSIFPLGQVRSLIVSQTDEVHEQVAQLLTGLRQARDAQAPAPRVTSFGSLIDAITEASSREGRDPAHTVAAPAVPDL
jgi:hypothetical protein